jgi:Domain of unknown function (DUF6089)
MKKGYLRVLLLATFLLISSNYTCIFAQNWEVGTTIGGSFYNGDIDVTPLTLANEIRFGGGIFVRYHINNWLGLRVQANAGTMFADEKNFGSSAWRTRRGFSFSSPIYELALLPQVHPFRLGNFEPFLFVGIAGAAFDPTTQYNEPNPTADVEPDINARIEIDKKTSFSRVTLAIPVGGGIQWFPNDRFAIGFEAGGRKTFSDYLDHIKASVGGSAKDFYFFTGVTVSYFFGSGNGFSSDWYGKGGQKGRGVSCPTF